MARIDIGNYIVKQYKVRSTSESDKFHIVSLMKDDKLRCDCYAGSMNYQCHHQRKIRQHLNNQNENVTNLPTHQPSTERQARKETSGI